MKLCRFSRGGSAPRVGRVEGPLVVELPVGDLLEVVTVGGDAAGSGDGPTHRLDEVTLHHPFRPTQNIVIAGDNGPGTASVTASGDVLLRYHTKSPAAVLDPDRTVSWSGSHTREVYAAPQLAIVVGSPLWYAEPAEALAAVFGYSVALDLRAWDLMQLHQQWEKPISFDGFFPWGPCVTTADEVPDPARLAVSLTINGDPVVAGGIGDALLGVGEVLAEYSMGIRLMPGDVFLLGAPHVAGDGARRLVSGDIVTAGIDGLGQLTVSIDVSD